MLLAWAHPGEALIQRRSYSLFWKPPNKTNTLIQKFNLASFPSRVNPDTPVLLEDPVLCALAKKYKRSPAQISLRYLLQREIVVLAKSFSEKRIKENMQVMGKAVGI